ncbi:tryptophan 7-halogenase [Labedaea rhizosphaerae]|uniref:Halogenation protein CepH n=1 Tax=Labedaea rhizosphaerae TaxID=598644 RepID=A0A4R6SG31_LABRH|nr:tryptophan 7-halogenase [Labedaea rhizosphaerae]TDQ00316.1 halogenation protein CepH [Labedaea rhizosphaerae]
MTTTDWDVIVVGGGPGGSTAATVTALDGHRVLLLERGTLPRYQIGESLLPSTIHGVLPVLGVREEVEAAGFVRKNGGTFRWGTSPEPWSFWFNASPGMVELGAYGYQVERMKFDDILLRNARAKGVDVRQNHRVTGVLEEGDRVTGVRFTDADGVAHEATAKYVVDASGNGSRIHTAVGGQREYSEFFRNIAVFSYFEGAGRLPEPHSGNILSAAFDRGWIWFIPLSDTLTSVGVVVSVRDAEAIQANPDAALHAMIDQCPVVRQYLRDAKRSTTAPYDEVRVRRDYSYERTKLSRPGMVVVGDAAMFIDPVFSSGVHLSTYSALLAARAINTTLAGLADEAACFAEFDSRYRREFAVFRDFLVAFYKMNVDERSYFWEAKRIAHHDGSVLEAFVDLVGGMMPADLKRPSALPPEARNMPIPPAMVGAVGMSMEMGIRDMNGTLGASPVPMPPMTAGLLPTADGLRWEVPQGWAADETARAHAPGA